jgi:hypothetical protein
MRSIQDTSWSNICSLPPRACQNRRPASKPGLSCARGRGSHRAGSVSGSVCSGARHAIRAGAPRQRERRFSFARGGQSLRGEQRSGRLEPRTIAGWRGCGGGEGFEAVALLTPYCRFAPPQCTNGVPVRIVDLTLVVDLDPPIAHIWYITTQWILQLHHSVSWGLKLGSRHGACTHDAHTATSMLRREPCTGSCTHYDHCS